MRRRRGSVHRCRASGGDAGLRRRTDINGFAPDAARHDATVALLQRSSTTVYADIFCTGTLVTPTLVVTAAHCLAVQKGKNISARAPSTVAVYLGDDTYGDTSGVALAVAQTAIHPSYDPARITNDIAVVRLAAPVTTVAPVPVLPPALGFTAADAGMPLNFAGFGETETGSYNVKLQANGTLGGLGCSVSGCPNPGLSASQISYTQVQSGPCFGDSGGPAFVNRGGTWYLGGVTSYGDNNCTIYGVSTRVDAYASWIASFEVTAPVCVADGSCNSACAAGADPDCGGGGSCGDGVCGASESCDGRSGTSACLADCPGSSGGKPSSRYCYVGGVCSGAGCP